MSTESFTRRIKLSKEACEKLADIIEEAEALEILAESHTVPSEKAKENGRKLMKKYKTLEESKKLWEQWRKELEEDDNMKELENLYSRLDDIKRELLELEAEMADERLEHIKAVNNRNIEYQIKTNDRILEINMEVIGLLNREKVIIDKINARYESGDN